MRVLESLAGSFVLDVADRQPQRLHRRLVRWGMAPGLGDLTQMVARRLNRIGRVNDHAQLWAEFQEWGEPFPRLTPGPHHRRIFLP